MIFHSIISRLIRKPLSYAFASHKLHYGQGGFCEFNLTQGNYEVEFQTIWEDHCEVEVHDDSGNIHVLEEGSKTIIKDIKGEQDKGSHTKIQFRLPEDFTFYGVINGSITHKKSIVSNKLRSSQMHLELLGKNRLFQWGTFECPSYVLSNKQGNIDIRQSTFENGLFECQSLSAEKLLFSGELKIKADTSIYCRSIVTYGEAKASLVAKDIELESISGSSKIVAERSVKIDRLWGSPGGIDIKGGQIGKMCIQTGTGIIESSSAMDVSKITLGKLHKGKIVTLSETKIQIV